MTDQPLAPPKVWPPLIVASTKPTWVKVRDIALTLLMWVLFAIMLETEFEMFFGRNLARLGLSDFDSEWNWPEFFQALRPFVQVALVLVSVLVVASLLTLRRVARGRSRPGMRHGASAWTRWTSSPRASCASSWFISNPTASTGSSRGRRHRHR
jgi:hypothetical protein